MILPLYSSCHHLAAMATCTMLQSKGAHFLVLIFSVIFKKAYKESIIILGLWE